MKSKFVHLHTHTDYSYLDGMGKPYEYAKLAKEYGMTALAITDHGNTSGIYEMQKACEKEGIKPILGSEFYIDHYLGSSLGHLVVLAKNNNGLRNIFRMQEEAFVDKFYYKPRIDMDILTKYSSDVIVTSACLANQIPKAILAGDKDLAREIIMSYKSLLNDDFYIEIQNNSLEEQRYVNIELIKLAKELGIEFILTNDVHYPYKSDGELKEYTNHEKGLTALYSPHEVLLSIQVQKTIFDAKRMSFSTQDFWFKTEKEMKSGLDYLDDVDVERAIDNTSEIANKCNAKMIADNYLPHYHSIPEGTSEGQLLREITTKKYNDKFLKSTHHSKEMVKQISKELKVIDEMGYSGYYLIVQDFVQGARDRGVYVGPGRGSGSASATAFINGITQVNPLEYNLLFERFLTPGRVPDIDLDFSDIDEVFEYLVSKYGQENVGRIMSFSVLAPKACTDGVVKALGHTPKLSSMIKGEMPKEISFDMKYAYNNPKLLEMKKENPVIFSLIERLEGITRHASKHAGGVVIWNRLSDVLPVESDKDNRNKRIVALNMDELEELGHFKFDILGLNNLPIIRGTLENIKEQKNICIDLLNIPKNDEEVYRNLRNGNVAGVFQLEAQVNKVIEQAPNKFEDIIAINALIRPGVGDWKEYLRRRRGGEYQHIKERDYYMNETEGTIVYQEQYLLDCKTFAGWDIAFADKNVRKNKNIKNDVKLKEKFINDCKSRGYDKDISLLIWEDIVTAVQGGYAFNKAHSASYGELSYQTAYLQTKYPVEFFASLLTNNYHKNDELLKYMAYAKERGIQILPPDINKMSDKFEIEDGKIRFMFSAIKGIGSVAYQSIKNIVPINSLQELIEKTTPRQLNKANLETIIKAGIFDFEEKNRIKLLNKMYELRKLKQKPLPEDMWSESIAMMYEYEALGTYLTAHPVEKYKYRDFKSFNEKEKGMIAGKIEKVETIIDKNGNKMAFVDISNQYGMDNLLVFSNIWNNKNINTKEKLQEGNLVQINGERSGDKFIVWNVEELF